MSTTPTFGTQVIGQTEKALNAILERQLAGTGLTEPQWVTLALTVVSGGTVDRDEGSPVKVTDAGQQLHTRSAPPSPRSPRDCGATCQPKTSRPRAVS